MAPVRVSFLSLFSRMKSSHIDYDAGVSEPVIHKSICTGETTAGLIDRTTGKYTELRRISGEKDLIRFCKDAGIDRDKIKTIY